MRGRRGADERGSAIIIVLLVAMILTTVGMLLLSVTSGQLSQSGRAVRTSTAYQAAEAGVDDYIAKLTEDHQYYAHTVHPAESTRRNPRGVVRAAGAAWTGDLTWTYPNGKDAWRSLGNGYEYDLQITAPAPGSPSVRIVSTGRRAHAAGEWRAVEALVRPASVVDFQMIADADISYGATASTYGKVYAGVDASGHGHSINHDGVAYADLYAEQSVTGGVSYRNGAHGYGSSTIRTKLKNPINFNSFTGSLVDVQRAAAYAGILLDDATADAWQLTFASTGTVNVAKCRRSRSADVADQTPTCGTPVTYSVPANGAVYANQTVIVSGVVKGRLTVASNANVVVGGNLTDNQPGTDVIGLIAKQEMIVARWAPYNLSWSAATIARSGQWRSFTSDGSHGTMTFTGSTATYLGGYMTMFQTRVYNYDTNLLYLQPPYFPVLEEAYRVQFFREISP